VCRVFVLLQNARITFVPESSHHSMWTHLMSGKVEVGLETTEVERAEIEALEPLRRAARGSQRWDRSARQNERP